MKKRGRKDKQDEEEIFDPPAAGGGGGIDTFSLDHTLFTVLLTRILDQEATTYKDILSPNQAWRMHPDFVRKLEEHTVLLCRHYVKRASLFGQYRSDPDMLRTNKKKRPPPMECREADFNLAWQTLEQDSK